MGYGTISLAGGIIELIARGIIALVTRYFGQFRTICIGYPLAWLFAGIFFIIVYFHVIGRINPEKNNAQQNCS